MVLNQLRPNGISWCDAIKVVQSEKEQFVTLTFWPYICILQRICTFAIMCAVIAVGYSLTLIYPVIDADSTVSLGLIMQWSALYNSLMVLFGWYSYRELGVSAVIAVYEATQQRVNKQQSHISKNMTTKDSELDVAEKKLSVCEARCCERLTTSIDKGVYIIASWPVIIATYCIFNVTANAYQQREPPLVVFLGLMLVCVVLGRLNDCRSSVVLLFVNIFETVLLFMVLICIDMLRANTNEKIEFQLHVHHYQIGVICYKLFSLSHRGPEIDSSLIPMLNRSICVIARSVSLGIYIHGLCNYGPDPMSEAYRLSHRIIMYTVTGVVMAVVASLRFYQGYINCTSPNRSDNHGAIYF